MIAALVSVTLSFTLPTHNAVGCEPDTAICSDLATLEVWQDSTMLAQYSVMGLTGRYTIVEQAQEGSTVTVTTTDDNGNRSCHSNGHYVHPVTDVPEIGAPTVGYFDVFGRQTDPSIPGIYWRVIHRPGQKPEITKVIRKR